MKIAIPSGRLMTHLKMQRRTIHVDVVFIFWCKQRRKLLDNLRNDNVAAFNEMLGAAQQIQEITDSAQCIGRQWASIDSIAAVL